MGAISSSIEIQDGMTPVLQNISNSLTELINTMQRVDTATQTMVAVQQGISNSGSAAANSVNSAWETVLDTESRFSTMQFNSDPINALIERMQQVEYMQNSVMGNAVGVHFLPQGAIADMTAVSNRLTELQTQVQGLRNVNIDILGADRQAAALTNLRKSLNEIRQTQMQISNSTLDDDVSAVNAGFAKLNNLISQTEDEINSTTAAVEQTENAIRQATRAETTQCETQTEVTQATNQTEQAQNQVNNAINKGVSSSNNLLGVAQRLLATYLGAKTIDLAVGMSDTIALGKQRLALVNETSAAADTMNAHIMQSSMAARASYVDTLNQVAKLATNASKSFNSNDEITKFVEEFNKMATLGGASVYESSQAMYQLTQSMAKGRLDGDELRSVMEGMPLVAQSIADYLGVDVGTMKELASEGQVTAEVVKNALFTAAEETDAKFESLPYTWTQIWTLIQSGATQAFAPLLTKINELANNTAVQQIIDGVVDSLTVLSSIACFVVDTLASGAQLISDNWDVIAPIVFGVVGALMAYAAWSVISAAVTGVLAVAKGIQAAATVVLTGATWAATTAQLGLNGAMYASPILWIVMAFIAFISVIFAVCSAIAKMTGAAASGFGVMTGGVNVVIQFFKNLGLQIANIALGIWNALSAVAENFKIAFMNAVKTVQAFFCDFASVVVGIVAKIAGALNMLPFVSLDVQGLEDSSTDWANKAQAARDSREEFVDIGKAFDEGLNTFDTFQEGWVEDAFQSGAAWGDGVAADVEGAFDFDPSSIFDQEGLPEQPVSGGGGGVGGMGELPADVGSIAGDTGEIKDTLETSNEELTYLRDIAEQEAINRYTTVPLTVNFSNSNTVNNGMDLDGVTTHIEQQLIDALNNGAEVAHA